MKRGVVKKHGKNFKKATANFRSDAAYSSRTKIDGIKFTRYLAIMSINLALRITKRKQRFP
jgi:hypothetical protein